MVNLFRPDTWGRRGEGREPSAEGSGASSPSSRTSSKGPLPRSKASLTVEQTDSLRAMIRELAYMKWKESGCPEGQDERFWLEAEREVLSRSR